MVLSQAITGRWPCASPIRSATARIAARSTSVFSGLEGLSTITRLTRPRSMARVAAASIASAEVPSEKPSEAMPNSAMLRASRVSVPP